MSTAFPLVTTARFS